MLDPSDRRLCQLFAAIAWGDWDEVRRLRRRAPAGEPDRRWREALLMVHLFAGVPRMIEAFDLMAEEGGVGHPEPDEMDDVGSGRLRGAELFERIYGARSDAVRTHLRGLHPELGRWVAGHVYGDVLSRPGLEPAVRELLAVAALATLGQDRQLAGHARGAVRCGATRDAVLGVIETIPDTVPFGRRERAREIVSRFAARA